MTRYVRIADRPAVRYEAIDVRCPTCTSPPGTRCRAMRRQPEHVVVIAGRVRRRRAGLYAVGRELRQAHASRRTAAREATARRARSGRYG